MKRINFKTILPSLISIVIGMIIGIIVLILTNPENALEGTMRLFKGPFNQGLLKGFGNLFYYSTPIMMTGLSVGFAFQTGLFNIGASGQFVVGAFTAIFITVKWTSIPPALLWIVALIGAAVAGALWASLGGILKATKNVNEVITSIMMNYIGMYLVNYLILNVPGMYNSTRNQTVNPSVMIPTFGLDKIFTGSFANGGIVIAVLIALIIYIVLTKTTFGFELKSVGKNRHAAKYAGVNEKRSIIISMLIAGALSGLGGGLAYLASTGRHLTVQNVLAAEGFNGIAVGLLGLNHPIGIIFSSMFISYIQLGGQAMQTIGYKPEIVSMMIAIILYISALSLLFERMLNRSKTKPLQEELEEVSENE